MSVDERTRHEMYTGLEAALGAPVADALMAHLPPTGWADVARTHDLEVLRADMSSLGQEMVAMGDRLRREMVAMEDRIGLRFDARLHAEINRLLLLLAPTILSTLGLTFAAARFA
jgi:hypothetical protein